MRLDLALAALIPEHSRSRLQNWVKDGRVRIDSEIVTDPKKKLRGLENIELETAEDASVTAFAAEDMPLDVVFEDETILVINKPTGLVVHPGSGNWSGTLLNGLLGRFPGAAALPRAGIVHRLDKDTSGLMVVAKTLTAQTDLVRQLQARTVKRHYHAIALGQLDDRGLVDAPIGRHPSQRTKMAVVANGREARTHFRVLERFVTSCWVECSLETGRTHQIRVHMAHIDHPLLGDPVYAGRRAMPLAAQKLGRQALHAHQLGLIHPEKNLPMSWQAPMPADMQSLLVALREGP